MTSIKKRKEKYNKMKDDIIFNQMHKDMTFLEVMTGRRPPLSKLFVLNSSPLKGGNIALPMEQENHSDCLHFPVWCPHLSSPLGSVLGYNRVSVSSYLH